jgi:hypothetical protein
MAFKPVLNRPQTDLLLDHFKVKPTITAREAEGAFKIRSLSRRINDLEDAGYTFSRTTEFDTTGQRYVRYHFIGKPSMRTRFQVLAGGPTGGGKSSAPAALALVA